MLSAVKEAPPHRVAKARALLSERLSERREELEAAVTTRVYGIADPTDLDPTYVDGLRGAVSAALDYGLSVVKLGEERSPPPPVMLLAQARLAARNGVNLDAVVRRYFAGYALLVDWVVEEAEQSSVVGGLELRSLLRGLAALFDRLLAAVSEEHTREAGTRRSTTDRRRVERLERLLAGEPVDVSELDYDFDGRHLGLVAKGDGGIEAMQKVATLLDRRLLTLDREGNLLWAWLGGRRPVGTASLCDVLDAVWPDDLYLAIGEPGEGLVGWRLTHRQAKAALPVALRKREPYIRYAEVAVLASMLQDDLLTVSLRRIYLKPLEREKGRGEKLRETLRAYAAARYNVSSTASSLGVDRRTVANRLRQVEDLLGCPIAACSIELEAALCLEDLEESHTIGHGDAAEPARLPDWASRFAHSRQA